MIWDSSFLRKACIIMNFSLRTAFVASCRFCMVVFFHCHLFQGIFKFPFWFSHWPIVCFLFGWFGLVFVFSSILFSLHVVSFFSFILLWLISSFMPLWSEKMLEIIYILLNLLRLVLCPSVCPWEYFMCTWRECISWGFFDIITKNIN